jgi:hypothetical protein
MESFVSGIPAGDGKTAILFFTVQGSTMVFRNMQGWQKFMMLENTLKLYRFLIDIILYTSFTQYYTVHDLHSNDFV